MSAAKETLCADVPREDSDAEFLRWVAGWLDRIDPIIKTVFLKSPALTDDERERITTFLEGTDVQERLRAIASGHTDLGRGE